MKKYLAVPLLFILISVFSLFNPFLKVIKANSAPFDSYETFDYEDGLTPAPGWNQSFTVCYESTGCSEIEKITNSDNTEAKWTVKDGHYYIHITSHNPLVFARSFPINWPTNLKNYEIIFDIYTLQSINYDRNFVFRYIDPNKWYELHFYGNNIFLDKALFDTSTKQNKGKVLAQVNNYPFENNSTYTFKIKVSGKNIKIYDLTKNQNTLLMEADDLEEPHLYGPAGPQSGSGANSSGDVWFDNIKVIDLDTTPTPEVLLNVPDLKQFSEPWADDIYDQASSWSVNPTIKRWGCALTSATMVLRYFNHLIDPGNLNQWLKTQVDGYIPNGLVNWLAISRFSKVNNVKIDASKDLPSLEYQRIKNPTTEDVKSALNSLIAPIIGVPGHFVVGNGLFGPDILVRDPASSTRTKLAEVESYYSGKINKLNNFVPSHTDLSYVMVISPSNLDFKITDSAGNEVGSISDEQGIVEDSETFDPNIKSGAPLNLYLIPKPEPGKYLLKTISGTGKFPLLVYMYDTDGNLIGDNIETLDIISAENSTNTLHLVYDSSKNTPPFEITFENLLNDLNILRKLGWINPHYQNSLRNRLFFIQLLKNHSKKAYQRAMKAILQEIKLMPGSRINEDGKSILIRDITYLISL